MSAKVFTSPEVPLRKSAFFTPGDLAPPTVAFTRACRATSSLLGTTWFNMIDTANLELRKVAIVVANQMICPENEQSDGKAGHADGF